MKRTLMIAMAAGTCLAAGQAALAQQVVNISGATLLENYVKAPASTNDYIDVDKNLTAGSLGSMTVQQLAGPSSGTGVWNVQYRAVGSVNGFIELTKFGSPFFVTTNDMDPLGILGAPVSPNPTFGGVATNAYKNRVLFISGGFATGAYNSANPGGAPDRAATAGADRTAGSTGGITIDIAPLDVSSKWATFKTGGTALPTRTPLQAGYGLNPRVSAGKNGETTPNVSNPELSGGIPVDLPGLNGRNYYDPMNPGAADSNTLFDTSLALAPIAPVVNLGTGITQIKVSELQHIFVTGRSNKGENLVVVTRDVGSGTRNAFMNCIGIDPSWGVGDNIGGQSTLSSQDNLGASYYPSNKGANGGVENTLRNTRLGIGYIGTERGASGSGSQNWLGTNALEIADTQNDIYGGTSYVRPTISNIVHNNANGWVIGGESVLCTLGDPRAEPVNDGGDANGNPAMVNKSAASYVNNITRSIEAFVAVPGGSNTLFMPGEFAATQFILLAALDNLHNQSTPTTLGANPGLVTAVQNYALTNNVHTSPLYASFNTASTGRNPTRVTGTTYSDGVIGGGNYIDQSGASVGYAAVTNIRNKIAYDFNGDGARTLADAADMIAAWRQRNGGPAWIAPNGVGLGTSACIEILGDGNGDGSFTSADVRYWADGLAFNGGQLDRKAGFIAVDTAFAGNFFGTTKAGCATAYVAGDARADIAGPSGQVAPGWAPVGADGVINAYDINYVYAQMRAIGITTPWSDGLSASWSNINEAARFDLSADINGDLAVSRADIEEILSILKTRMGDVNLDGVVTAADRTIVLGNMSMSNLGWAGGDLNGDGTVSAADLALVCPADSDGTGVLAVQDIFDFLNGWFAGECRTDFNGGGLSVQDIFDFLNAWFGGC